MRQTTLRFLCAVAVVGVSLPDVADAQAFCALRDPVRTIYDLYPAASSYRSIVATVGEQARSEIASRLGMALHHAELGRHTLYVVVNGDRPIGLVHVRAEITQWGLAEIAWALDFDLRVVDFRIQRARSASRETLGAEAFRSQLRGKTAAALAAMLAPGASGLTIPGVQLSADDEVLAHAIVTSGLMAIAASQSVWGQDIGRLRASARDAR